MDALQESPNLDFLRSYAVLSVFGFHVLYLFEHRHSPYLNRLRVLHSIGHWGVLIFFVHTSLVLMFSLERQQLRFPGRPIYTPFLTRRIFRIFPLSMFVVLLVAALKLPVADLTDGSFRSAHLHFGEVVSNLLLVQNLTHTDSVIIPLWSLPYEMQMYLLLPGLFFLVCSARYYWSVPVLWATAALAGKHIGWLDRNGLDFVIFIPCFLSGVIAYKLTKTWRLKLPAFLWPPTLVILTALYLRQPTYQNAWYCCLMLGLAIPQFQEMKSRIGHRISQTIARYSYGIYLTHLICMWLAFQALGNIPVWSRWIILLTTVCATPYVLYHQIEKPMIRYGVRIANAVRSWVEYPLFASPGVQSATK
jgi:peptidoglycan/LPS O-acetylase OafA/YrhL